MTCCEEQIERWSEATSLKNDGSLRIPWVMRDGAAVLIRAAQPDDAARLERLFFRLSPRTLYQYFLLTIPLAAHQAYRVTTLARVEHGISYAAVVCEGEEIRGIARYACEPAPETAELSLLIEDAWQECGLGKALASKLIAEALRHGITQYTVTTHGENVPALRLVKALFPQAQLAWNEGTLQSHLSAETAEALPKRSICLS